MLHNENEILQGGQDDEVVLRAMTIEEKMEEIDFNKNQEKGLSINQEILEILIIFNRFNLRLFFNIYLFSCIVVDNQSGENDSRLKTLVKKYNETEMSKEKLLG